ncbi:MAG: sigma-70 family RNA polymerase sigma factor [Saprospiraceae bacterium]|nr:sigma-70 family RNA polymerase sigma factor [Saprospiraceae bacterium]
MLRVFDTFFDRSKSACTSYIDNQALYEGLRLAEDKAIQCVQSKIAGTVNGYYIRNLISKEESEEVMTDTIMILLRKIQQGEYQFLGNSPSTFAVEIAKRIVQNYSRKNNRHFDDIDSTFHIGEDSLNDYFAMKERDRLVAECLKSVGENCERLLRLKYFEGYRDEEIIQLKLTQYTTADTVKNKRSECLKKLTALIETQRHNFFE